MLWRLFRAQTRLAACQGLGIRRLCALCNDFRHWVADQGSALKHMGEGPHQDAEVGLHMHELVGPLQRQLQGNAKGLRFARTFIQSA